MPEINPALWTGGNAVVAYLTYVHVRGLTPAQFNNCKGSCHGSWVQRISYLALALRPNPGKKHQFLMHAR